MLFMEAKEYLFYSIEGGLISKLAATSFIKQYLDF